MSAEYRAERYRLQFLAKKFFCEYGKKENLKFAWDYHATAKCLRAIVPGFGSVEVKMCKKKGFFKNLERCKNVWTCPVCAQQIQEKRRIEVCKAISWAYNKETGCKCLLVTLTFPHNSSQSLEGLLEKQKIAFKGLRGGKAWTKFKEKIGLKGLIRSLEITHGSDGWHPHTHELWIVDKNCNAEEVKNVVLAKWKTCCCKVGLLPKNRTIAFAKRAVDVIDNANSSSYLSKQNTDLQCDVDGNLHWGVDREIVTSNKKGRGQSVTPFEILAETENGKPNREVLIEQFMEYVAAMKGKAQVFWSRGLKAEAGVLEKSDEEIVNEKLNKGDVLAWLSDDHWKLILKKRARAKILTIAEKSGLDGIKKWFKNQGMDCESLDEHKAGFGFDNYEKLDTLQCVMTKTKEDFERHLGAIGL